ncbi:hypothetical protein [Piscirickettsia litoralis]|uniref:Type VI lipoprotein IgE-like C-terminal domain-containing protein n=1 Tax=Piscirickettsia litoralis TaxID=1891921 RepID=A0ABX3A287_9GAMM|nr:hypothetical protein [Piscirickettsia litoralis]ODN42558.1 hypothetical protein BGC07_05965 [Piscirickettsia litoralis]
MKKRLVSISYCVSIMAAVVMLNSCSMLGLGGDPKFKIKVKTDKYVNNGNNFYLLVVQDDSKNYIGNNYYSLYSQFNNDKYKKYFITPKYKSTYLFYYTYDNSKPISLYFLFNSESRQWKKRVKVGVESVIVEVNNNIISSGN